MTANPQAWYSIPHVCFLRPDVGTDESTDDCAPGLVGTDESTGDCERALFSLEGLLDLLVQCGCLLLLPGADNQPTASLFSPVKCNDQIMSWRQHIVNERHHKTFLSPPLVHLNGGPYRHHHCCLKAHRWLRRRVSSSLRGRLKTAACACAVPTSASLATCACVPPTLATHCRLVFSTVCRR